MPRFENLEFGDPEPQRKVAAAPQRDPLHDEHYWMKQADDERRGGCYENALRYYSRALEMDRSIIAAWVGQVRMLIAMGEFPEAEVWSRKANDLFHNNPELIAARAHALVRCGDLSKAQPLCDAAIVGVGKDAYPWIVRGECMLAGRDSMEQHCFDKARQLSPDWLVRLEIADSYVFFRRIAKALSLLREAVELAPDRAHLWYRQGICEREMRLETAARRSLQRCCELAPRHLEARRNLEQMDRRGWWPRMVLRRLFSRE